MMASQKSNFKIFEFGPHNLNHEIPLNEQNQSIMLQIGRDMATCVLALSPSNLCILVSVHNLKK